MNNGINLDGDAAVVGGIHSDSHDVTNNVNTYNTTNNTTNQTIYQVHKSIEEIRQENEKTFIKAVTDRIADGILTDTDMAELNRIRLQLQIPQHVANAIIDQVKRSAIVINSYKADDFLSNQLLEEIYNALEKNQKEILERKLSSLEKVARNSTDSEVQFYYHLLLASLYPETSTMRFINSSTDNYWQLFWVHIAYLKLGNTQTAEALLPRLNGFGSFPGNIALLMALDNLWEYKHKGENPYYSQQASTYLQKAIDNGMDETLSSLWSAADIILSNNLQSGPFIDFFVRHTLKEFNVQKCVAGPTLKMSPPPLPKFDAQNVNLNQMQGFNPLQAAQHMRVGLNGMMQYQRSNNDTCMSNANIPPMPHTEEEHSSLFTHLNGSYFQTANRSSKVSTTKMSSEEIPDEFGHHYGIFLTDTNILSQKYNVDRESIIKIFSSFFENAEAQNMHWGFLDMSDHYDRLGNANWIDYNRLISEFIQRYGLSAGPDLHLMIVGGDDVIPVPEVNDPYNTEGTLPTDTCYCFEETYLQELVDGGNLSFEAECARNNVARLPLENGNLPSDPESDLGSFFNLCDMYGGGIPVDNVVMISNEEWIPASATMSQHLPLQCYATDTALTKDRMYISPKLLTNNEQAMHIYLASIAEAGMLMFNLHGADSPDMPGFYSNDEAFHPSMLRASSARIFNTVACFGARYKDGYTRQQSMLLSALYGGGILLYTGSLIPVPMYEDNEVRELIAHPGTGSEVFMRLYPLYQFKGMTAGRALLQAKCDYFNLMRKLESDGFSLSTALMFCLYGNPMLHVKAREDVINAARNNTSITASPVKAIPNKPVKQVIKQRLMTKGQQSNLLEQVRGYVDYNISVIRSLTERYVYQSLGLPPAYLESIDSINTPLDDGSYQTQYSFNYHDPTARFSQDKSIVTDVQGNIKRIYSYK